MPQSRAYPRSRCEGTNGKKLPNDLFATAMNQDICEASDAMDYVDNCRPGNNDDASERLQRFTEHLVECQTTLFAHVFALVQNMADAEDICQRSHIILWQKFDHYVEGTNFYSWALKIAHYEAMNYVRRRRRDRLFFCEETLEAIAREQEDEVENTWRATKKLRLDACLKKLPQRQRKLVQLYYEGSRTISDIANQLSRSDNAIRVSLCRVRKMLRECVDRTPKEEMG